MGSVSRAGVSPTTQKARKWTPDAEICDTQLPHGDEDAWAALYTNLLGTQQQPATRASWDALGLHNLYAIFLPGPDAFTTKSWHATVANGSARLVRGAENGAAAATPATRGSHVHAVAVTVEQCEVDPALATTPPAQVALDQLHRFALRYAFGQELLIQPGSTKYFDFNYWQNVLSVTSTMKVIGYAAVGKDGIRAPGWLIPDWVNWVGSLVHCCIPAPSFSGRCAGWSCSRAGGRAP